MGEVLERALEGILSRKCTRAEFLRETAIGAAAPYVPDLSGPKKHPFQSGTILTSGYYSVVTDTPIRVVDPSRYPQLPNGGYLGCWLDKGRGVWQQDAFTGTWVPPTLPALQIDRIVRDQYGTWGLLMATQTNVQTSADEIGIISRRLGITWDQADGLTVKVLLEGTDPSTPTRRAAAEGFQIPIGGFQMRGEFLRPYQQPSQLEAEANKPYVGPIQTELFRGALAVDTVISQSDLPSNAAKYKVTVSGLVPVFDGMRGKHLGNLLQGDVFWATPGRLSFTDSLYNWLFQGVFWGDIVAVKDGAAIKQVALTSQVNPYVVISSDSGLTYCSKQ
ncbi:MAG: hypothetical protein ABIG95_00650 [Candidatus Woesearchaeota archaeon]